MSEMVERIAAALEGSFKNEIAEASGMPFEKTGVVLPGAVVWERYALAALGALRTPTEAMIDLGDTAYSDNENRAMSQCNGVRNAYTAMIEEAGR